MSTLSVNNIESIVNLTVANTITIGNSTVNSTFTSTGISDVSSINTTSISVGSNVSINTSSISVGNSTVNTTSISVGSNVSINTSSISVGNSTVNTAISSGNISINGSNISPTMSFRNVLINGNFNFWQRGTSGTGNEYVADRWAISSVGSTKTGSRQSFTLGQTDVPNNPQYWHRMVVTSVAGASNYTLMYQPIEGVRTFAGQTVTLSFYAKADAAKNIAVEFEQGFGTGGSPSTAVNSIVTTVALTTSWAKHTITVAIPSISGKTLGTNNNDYLNLIFWFDAGSTFNARTNSLGQQSGTFDIAQVQLEAGSVATPFELRPLGTELALCQRYYEVGGTRTLWSGYGVSGQNYFHTVGFKVGKRSTPSMGGTDVGNSGFPAGVPTFSVTDTDNFYAYKTCNSTTSSAYFQYTWTASAEL